MAFIKEIAAPVSMPKALSRTNAIPLDPTSVWYSLGDLQNYATTNAAAYVGQIVAVVDQENKTAVAYIITNVDGELVEIGSGVISEGTNIESDGVSIIIEDNKAALYDFGKVYYRWDDFSKAYVRQEVNETYPWKEGLEPKVVNYNDAFVLGWYESNPTIENDLADIQEILYDVEDEEGNITPGLVSKFTTLETDVDNLEKAVANTYTKEQVDGKLTGLFHFSGTAESYDDLPETANNGDVYQVGDKEYAWDGNTWVELGISIDLSNYATKAEVKTVDDKVTANTNAIADLQAVDSTLDTELKSQKAQIVSLTSDLSAVTGDLSALETVVGTETVGEIAGTGLIRRVETLENYIGELEAVGGQPNIIEKVYAGTTELIPVDKAVTIPVYEGTVAGLVPVMNSTLVVENTTNSDYVLTGSGAWALLKDKRIGDLTYNGTTYGTVEKFIAAYAEDISATIIWEQI